MKIGYLIGNDSPTSGGAYTFGAEILESLTTCAGRSRHEVVLFGHDEGPPPDTARLRYVSLRKHFLGRAAFKILRGGDRTEAAIRQSGVDMMFYLTPYSCVTTDVPYFTVVWDLAHRTHPEFPEVSAKGEWSRREAVYARALAGARFVVAGTRAGADQIKRFYGIPRQRIKILSHPTPSFAFEEGAPHSDVLRKYGIPPRYLFYPAQFWLHKNHEVLLKTAAVLNKKGLSFPVVFTGTDKGNQANVRRLADRLGLSSQVYFLGFVPREDLVGLYRKAFALVYVSLLGPENLPPLEAFALGCPVIASRVVGAEEQLGTNALLVEPRDEEGIARAVQSLLEEKWRDTLIERGTRRGRCWTGQDFIKGLFSIVDELESHMLCVQR